MGSCLAASASARVMTLGGDHAFEGGVALAGGGFDRFEGIEGIRAADDAGQQGGLGEREFGRMFFEVNAGGLADAVDLAAPVDLVDVGFEDLVLFEHEFEPDGDGDFEELAVELARDVAAFLAAFELEDVGDELLGDGGGTLAFALGVLDDGADDADGVEGTMVVKPLVLAGEDGLAEVFGNLAQRHDRAFFTVDAADFLAQAVADDRALGHGVDLAEIVLLRAETVDYREKQQARRAQRRPDSRKRAARNLSGWRIGRVTRWNR